MTEGPTSPPRDSGLLRVDKPVGPTSHDIVARARRALGTRRVGHTGTLDPFASGLLLLCVGSATRLSAALTGLPKTYEAEAVLGVRTDTDDREGVTLEVRPGADALGVEQVDAALASFRGPLLQVPPVYSAKKVEGEAVHRRARRGETVELPPAPVEILAIERLEWVPPILRFRVECSSGTYVRALARDLGEALGVGGHLSALRRTRIGWMTLEDAVAADRLDDDAAREAAWLPPREALRHLPAMDVDGEAARRLRLGQTVPVPLPAAPEAGQRDGGVESGGEDDGSPGVAVAVFHGDDLVALAERRGLRLHPRTVFPA